MGAYDQSRLEQRKDVLVYTSDPLAHDLRLAGPTRLQLWVLTNAPDADYVGRLCIADGDAVVNIAAPSLTGVETGATIASSEARRSVVRQYTGLGGHAVMPPVSAAEEAVAVHEGADRPIYVLGLGGSLRRPSESEVALRMALRGAEEAGAETDIITADGLDLPLYPSPKMDEHPAVVRLLAAARRADGFILASPAYHGTMSGALKNALDYFQFLARDVPPYLDGRAVGVLSTGAGTQAAVQTVNALRDVVHALRAWPTPIGVPIHESGRSMAVDGEIDESRRSTAVDEEIDERTAIMLRAMGAQVVEFALAQRAWRKALSELEGSRA